MRLATFTHANSTRLGVVVGEEIVDLGTTALPRDMIAFLEGGPDALAGARAAVSAAPRLALATVKLEAPVSRPPEFLAVGLNYADHVEEAKLETPKFPLFFNKQSSCVNGPYDPIHLPKVSNKLDYEGELAFVIGRKARHVPKERAHEVIAGYMICNDVSVRDWQFKAPTWTLGKSFDTHGPIGPCIVTADELGDPHALTLSTWVNGERRQYSNTKHLIFNCFQCVETLSTVFTLLPGTIITTGTPGGVGGPMRIYLQAGDVVKIAIDGLGHLESTVVPEPATAVG